MLLRGNTDGTPVHP